MPNRLFAYTPLFPLSVVVQVLPIWRSFGNSCRPGVAVRTVAPDRRSERRRKDEMRMERILKIIDQTRRAARPSL